jgi:hypothetical protein
MRASLRCLLVNALSLAAAQIALAGAHTWDVNEVFTNSDGTIQFIEFVEANGTPGETGLPSQNTTSNTRNITIGGGPLSPPTSNKHFLLATAAFAALPGSPTPDSIIPAGSVPFFSAAGDTVTYGPYDSWNFGTVPTNGVDSLNRTGTAVRPASPTNYAGETGPAVPALEGLGVGLVIGLLILAGVAVALRSRAKAA